MPWLGRSRKLTPLPNARPKGWSPHVPTSDRPTFLHRPRAPLFKLRWTSWSSHHMRVMQETIALKL
eukprot:3095694-Heterocapsa_arctica.AAC.1